MSSATMMRNVAVLMAILSAVPGMAVAEQAPAWMKPGPGQEEVTSGCATCHTLNYIRMHAGFLTPDQWKAEVTKMRAAFGAPIDDDAAAKILQYLDTNYAAPPKS